MYITTLKDIKQVIKQSGLTECESQDCQDCEFNKTSPEYEELGHANICILLNEVYRTK